MPEFVVDLGSIIVDAEDDTKAKEEVRRIIKESCGGDIVIDQAIRID